MKFRFQFLWVIVYQAIEILSSNSNCLIETLADIWEISTAYPCCFFDNVVPCLVWKWHVLLNQSLHDHWILQATNHIVTIYCFWKSYKSCSLQNTWWNSQKQVTYSLCTDHVSNCLIKSVNLDENKINEVHYWLIYYFWVV